MAAAARLAGRTGIEGDAAIEPHEDMDGRARAAMSWLIALKDDPEDAELARRIDAWCAEAAENARAYADALDLWDLLGEVPANRHLPAPPRPLAPAAAGVPPAAARTLAPRQRAGRILAAGTALAMAACLAIFALPGLWIWLAADHATGTAELRDIRLEDGSLVTLGAETAIDVVFETDRRHVRLLSGIAFFDVTSDPGRPFVVEAAGVETRVKGTSFEVGMAGGTVGVAVSSGHVEVAPDRQENARPLGMRPGDWSRVDGARTVERGRIAPERVATWRQGLLTANDETVAGIAEDIGRYYPGIVLVVGGDLARQRVSGVYRTGDPVHALEAVAAAHGAVLRQAGPWLLILSSI
jgi:transmembrane sensor